MSQSRRCWYFKRGTCSRGGHCWFSHDEHRGSRGITAEQLAKLCEQMRVVAAEAKTAEEELHNRRTQAASVQAAGAELKRLADASRQTRDCLDASAMRWTALVRVVEQYAEEQRAVIAEARQQISFLKDLWPEAAQYHSVAENYISLAARLGRLEGALEYSCNQTRPHHRFVPISTILRVFGEARARASVAGEAEELLALATGALPEGADDSQ